MCFGGSPLFNAEKKELFTIGFRTLCTQILQISYNRLIMQDFILKLNLLCSSWDHMIQNKTVCMHTEKYTLSTGANL